MLSIIIKLMSIFFAAGVLFWLIGLITDKMRYYHAPAFFYLGLFSFMIALFPLTIVYYIYADWEFKRSIKHNEEKFQEVMSQINENMPSSSE